jgi:hypothetical protein
MLPRETIATAEIDSGDTTTANHPVSVIRTDRMDNKSCRSVTAPVADIPDSTSQGPLSTFCDRRPNPGGLTGGSQLYDATRLEGCEAKHLLVLRLPLEGRYSRVDEIPAFCKARPYLHPRRKH